MKLNRAAVTRGIIMNRWGRLDDLVLTRSCNCEWVRLWQCSSYATLSSEDLFFGPKAHLKRVWPEGGKLGVRTKHPLIELINTKWKNTSHAEVSELIFWPLLWFGKKKYSRATGILTHSQSPPPAHTLNHLVIEDSSGLTGTKQSILYSILNCDMLLLY